MVYTRLQSVYRVHFCFCLAFYHDKWKRDTNLTQTIPEHYRNATFFSFLIQSNKIDRHLRTMHCIVRMPMFGSRLFLNKSELM